MNEMTGELVDGPGSPLSEHSISRARRLFSSIGIFIFLGMGVSSVVPAFLKPGTSYLASSNPLQTFGFGGILILIGLVMAVRIYHLLFESISFRFFENGIERVTLTGRHDFWQWADVKTAVYHQGGDYREPANNVRIEFKDGRKIAINSLYSNFTINGLRILEAKTGVKVPYSSYKDYF